MQLNADKFRKLVDQSCDQFPAPESYVRTLREFDGALVGDQLVDRLYKRISSVLEVANPSRQHYGVLRQLRTELCRQEAFGLPEEPYEQIIGRIWDASRSEECKTVDDDAAWFDAITIARAVIAIRGDSHSSSDNRRWAVNGSIRLLLREGFGLYLDANGIAFRSGEFGRLLQCIHTDVRKLGGLDVIAQLFHYLRATNQFDGDRYTPGRQLSMMGGARPPSTPVGFLLNVAVKYLDVKGRAGVAAPRIWERLVRRSVALCSILDVEPYSTFENIEVRPYQIGTYLSELSLFDHLFTFKQWSSRHAVLIIGQIFADVDRDWMAEKLGWTIDDAVALADAVLASPPPPFGFQVLHEKQIVGTCVRDAVWRRMKPAFVHGAGSINSEYLSPLNGDKSNWQDKPFISIGKRGMVTLSPSLVAPAFFEAISGALRRAKYPSLDDKVIPQAMERLIENEFHRRGFSIRANKRYRMFDRACGRKVDGECDAIVDGDNYILLIEAKKKSLTKASTTGSDLPNLVDLSDSLLHAQLQMSVHERLLRSNGCIEFTDGDRLDWNNRPIERIVVTLLDHGSTQDKVAVDKITRALAGVTIKSHGDESYLRSLAKLNERCIRMAEEIVRLEEIGVSQHEQMFGRWFMSIPQLCVLLDIVGSPDEFRSRFGKMRHFTMGLLDFYREMKWAEKTFSLSPLNLGPGDSVSPVTGAAAPRT